MTTTLDAAAAAVRTLQEKRYTYAEGAPFWRPPLGQPHAFLNAPPRDVWRWGGDSHDHLESMGNNMVIEITAAQLREALAEAAKAPEGWKLVPIKPTHGMPVAGGMVERGQHLFWHPPKGGDRIEVIGFGKACDVWEAMVAAAPTHGTPEVAPAAPARGRYNYADTGALETTENCTC